MEDASYKQRAALNGSVIVNTQILIDRQFKNTHPALLE
jgi:hypothetical protein